MVRKCVKEHFISAVIQSYIATVMTHRKESELVIVQFALFVPKIHSNQCS